MAVLEAYSGEELAAIYELGRLYFEMGYFPAAERIFSGLSAIDGGFTPARIGLGLLRIENGQYNDATTFFRGELPDGNYKIEAKLGMCAAFMALGEVPRARSLLGQIDKDFQAVKNLNPELQRLWQAFAIRCEAA